MQTFFIRKTNLCTISFLLLGCTCFAQSVLPIPTVYKGNSKIHYVRQWEPVKPITTTDNIGLQDPADIRQTTTYLDGLARPIQTVVKQASPLQKDMVTSVLYDDYGRETVKYLPFVSNGTNSNSGDFKNNPFLEQQLFYSSQSSLNGELIYYERNVLENSPFQRATQVFAPGNSWGGSNRGISMKYQFNGTEDKVRIWKIDDIAGSVPTSTSEYLAGRLYKSITIDEHGKKVVEYKDNAGRVVLIKTQIADTPSDDHTGWLCTYYIYDDFSQLRYVIQPKGVEAVANNGWVISAAIKNELCFWYEYDERNRMVRKKVPGAGETIMIYDKRDRLVFTRDGNMKGNLYNTDLGYWMVSLYDALNRPVATAIINYSGGEIALRNYVDQNTGIGNISILSTQLPLLRDLYVSTRQAGITEYKSSGSIQFTGEFTSESNAVFNAEIVPSGDVVSNETLSVIDNPVPPGIQMIYLTINYYDTYEFTNTNYTTSYNSQIDDGGNANAEAMPGERTKQTTGLVTGTKVRVIYPLENISYGGFLSSVTFYDDKQRVLQAQSTNYKSGIDILTSRYDFSGKALTTYLFHENKAANTIIRVKTNLKYDFAGRVLEIKKTINDNPLHTRVILKNEYDEHGQIKTKKIAPDFNGGIGIEDQQFDYNIRGWLLGINRNYVSGVSSNYFGFELGYDKTQTIVGNTNYSNAQFNSNIGGLIWRSKGDGERRKYDFTYDAVNRLKSADFTQYSDGTFNRSAGLDFSNTNLNYDANGNILSMNHFGWKLSGSTLIDQLQYEYSANSNKLIKVVDVVSDPNTKLGDFKNGTNYLINDGYDHYEYDANGNMIKDLNKDIFTQHYGNTLGGITYNHLNLPFQVSINGKGGVTYIYDATGNKLEKLVNESPTSANGNQQRNNITTYLGGFIYENDKLQFLGHEEGRVRYKIATTNTPEGFVYDYMIKDHLGNVRMVLTEEQQTDAYPVASLEAATLINEKLYYNIPDGNGVRVNRNTIPGYPTTDTYTSPNDYIQQLSGNGTKIGSSMVLKVMAGDKFNVRVSSWYRKNGTNIDQPVNPLADIIAALVPGVAGVGNKFTQAELASSGIFTPGVTNLLNDPSRANGTLADRPKAYLNWVLFDEQFKYTASSSGFEQVGAEDEFIIHLKNNLPIDKNGYLYIYLSNETPNINVFFDNLQVTHTRGALLEENSYYPFGLIQAGITSKAFSFGSVENKYCFNGYEQNNKEFSDGSGIEWYDYKHRFYDNQIGRFFVQDRLANDYAYYTPYQFAGNEVPNAIDLDGLEPQRIAVKMVWNDIKTDLKNFWYRGEGKTYQALDWFNRNVNPVGMVVFGGYSTISGKDLLTQEKLNRIDGAAQFTTGIFSLVGTSIFMRLGSGARSSASAQKIIQKGSTGNYVTPTVDELTDIAVLQYENKSPLDIIGGASIYGSKGINGSSFVYDLALVEGKNVNMVEILTGISAQAKNAGASSVKINGFSVVNEKLVELFKVIQENGGKFLGWQVTGGQKGTNVLLTKLIE